MARICARLVFIDQQGNEIQLFAGLKKNSSIRNNTHISVIIPASNDALPQERFSTPSPVGLTTTSLRTTDLLIVLLTWP
jgi:hypothetical protein